MYTDEDEAASISPGYTSIDTSCVIVYSCTGTLCGAPGTSFNANSGEWEFTTEDRDTYPPKDYTITIGARFDG